MEKVLKAVEIKAPSTPKGAVGACFLAGTEDQKQRLRDLEDLMDEIPVDETE